MKIDRLIGILSVLLQRDRITAAELSERFEVSRRTINRDIDTLCQAGIPVAAMQGNGGGLFLMEGCRIDRTLLTSADMSAILAGLKSLDSVSGTNSYRILMEKLSLGSSVTNDHIIIDLSYWDKSAAADKIELIKSAIENSEKISFEYHAPTGESRRMIEPYHLVFQWSSWYVWGYCTSRCDYRMFKLTRITKLKRTGEKCGVREVPTYICNKVRHTTGGREVKVKFSPAVKWRLIDEFGIDSFSVNEDGSVTTTFAWSDIPAFYNYILTFGENAEILEPEEYRKGLAELLNKISKKYET
ncbi:MAG: YafY family transcriptional regulator [Ruminococcus sp.]|nr:YafY family transcriptional regulator [Ruminococcus sp.]